MKLATDTDLADQFGIDLIEFHRLRRYHKWPAVKLGRNVYRFTDAQVEVIIERMTKGAGKDRPSGAKSLGGQTKRSAARRS